jgi:hypothetical protein
MATNSNLRGLQQIDHPFDTTDLFVYSGSIPVTRGTVVKVGGSGYLPSDAGIKWLGGMGAQYTNVVSQRYGSFPYVVDAATGDYPVGMTLWDVRETDEHGNKLIFDTKKADERGYVLSGQPVPIVTKGLVTWSGTFNGTAVVGAPVYASGDGALTANSLNQNKKVGDLWGAADNQGYYLIKVNC